MNRNNTAGAEARRQYMRTWRRNNPDKVRAQQERYWQRKGEEMLRRLQKEQLEIGPEGPISDSQRERWRSVPPARPCAGTGAEQA